jgi:hypothetical protein
VKIPVFIISFNRLDCLKKLVAWLESAEMAEPVIVDNASTYPPLVEWFEAMKTSIAIHRFETNYGPYRVWDERLYAAHTTDAQPFYVVTDPDVVPIAECPKDAIPRLVEAWQELRRPKIGLSLRYETIPDTLPSAHDIRRWEMSMQSRELPRAAGADGAPRPRCYDSMLDTSFQLNHRDVQAPSCGSHGIRLAHPYMADHLGWHLDPARLSPEDKYYWDTASHRASTIQTLRARGIAGSTGD